MKRSILDLIFYDELSSIIAIAILVIITYLVGNIIIQQMISITQFCAPNQYDIMNYPNNYCIFANRGTLY